MRGSFADPPIVITGQRWRGVLLALGSALFVAIGGYAMALGETPDLRVLVALLFFVFCAVVGAWMAIAPARLQIDAAGLSQRALGRTRRWAWSEVFDFRPAVIGLGTRVVGFNFTARQGAATGVLRDLNKALAGTQGALAAGYEIKPDDLAALLSQARQRWLDGIVYSAAITPAAPRASAAGQASGLGSLAGARMNRRLFWLAMSFLIALSLSFALMRGAGGAAVVTTLLAIRVYAGRLHDFGRSGWWTAGYLAAAAGAILGAGALTGWVQPAAEIAAEIAAGAVQLIWMIALGSVPGDPAPNRFGPPPGAEVAAATAENFR